MTTFNEDVKLIANLDYSWENFSNKTILISGGTGFIGSLINDVFRYRNINFNQNIKVISLSRGGGQSDSTVTYIKQDINNKLNITNNVDYILHLASNTHPKQYGEDPVGTITTNVIGCNNLLEYAASKNVKKFLLASSVEIYGEGKNFPMDESFSGYLNCNLVRNGYNESKRTCESLCQAYNVQYGVNIVIARLSRVFGPDKKNDSKAMAQFISRAVSKQNIILKSKGLQRYSYCYVADAVSGIIKILLDGQVGQAYNLSDDDENLTLGEYAEYIAKISENEVEQNIEEDNNSSSASYAILDTSKIKDELNWKPMFTVKEGIKRTIEIYQQNKL